ncbi:MAG: ABC transporter permease [Chloroflexota bacterium]
MEQFVVTTLRGATPIIIAALAGLFSVRAGIFHMGIEGLMLAGAFTAVAAGTATGSLWAGLLAAVGVNLLLSWLYWLLIDRYQADSIIAGLGLTTLCVGGTAFFMFTIFGRQGSMASSVRLPTPVSGPQTGLLAYVSELSIMVWLLPFIIGGCWLLLRRSRLGLHIAAVGQYPYGAEAAGVDISRTKLYACLLTGVGCALAGAQLSIGDIANFTENMTTGRGFIALAAILFGASHPLWTAVAGLFFGLADAIGIVSQLNANSVVPRQFILMIPFITTILAVTVSSFIIRRRRGIP